MDETRRIMGALETLVSTEDGPWKFGWPDDIDRRTFKNSDDDTSEMFTLCHTCHEPYVCHNGYKCPAKPHRGQHCRGSQWMFKHLPLKGVA
jgi:hypothetical protein